jgi:hypothetical protein
MDTQTRGSQPQMTKYWRLGNDAENYYVLTGDGPDFIPQDLYVDGGIDFSCIPLDMKFEFLRRKGKTKSDFVPDLRDMFICKNEVISDFLIKCKINSKIFDVTIGNEKYNLCIIITELKGFDEDRSKFERFENSNKIMWINSVKLLPDFVTDFDLFRLSDYYALRFELFCSDKFKQIYEYYDYTGLTFSDATS